jgi:YidC/Oxa1 family membrane protein insertase
MQELQRLAPQLKALQEKYKEDKQRQQQEIMNFYREHKVNPFASCLPLLLQLPVFISLFYMLRTDLKKHICGSSLVSHYNALHHAAVAHVTSLPAKYIEKTSCQTVAPHSGKFLFLADITNKATGVALVALILLYVGSQLASTLLVSASADPNQKRMMLIIPIFFVIILYKYPAGLLVYWITTNLWTILQQYIVRKRVGPLGPPAGSQTADGEGGGGLDGGPNGSGAGGGLGGLLRGRLKPAEEPAGVGAGSRGRAAAPPPPPRKKKKRSGRRR